MTVAKPVHLSQAGFETWYDSIEKSCDFFEIVLRLLDYSQYANRQWYLNKYMFHYYFQKNPGKAASKKAAVEDEETEE